MSIDDFLNKLKRSKRQADLLLEKYRLAEDEAESPRTINYSGMPHSRTNTNYTENSLIEVISAGEEWKKAQQEYTKQLEALKSAMYNLFYWEGLLIERAYILNPAFNHDNLYGLNEILKTDNRREILAKLDIAKAHLWQILSENENIIK